MRDTNSMKQFSQQQLRFWRFLQRVAWAGVVLLAIAQITMLQVLKVPSESLFWFGGVIFLAQWGAAISGFRLERALSRFMAAETGRLGSSLDSAMNRIVSSSLEVAAASDELSASAQEAGHAMDEIARVAAALARSAEQVGAASRESADAVAHAAVAAEGTARSSTQSAASAAHMRDSAVRGSETSEQIANLMIRVREAIVQVGKNAQLLNERTTAVAEIGKSLEKMSHEINILGLNASIEAARVSGENRGFQIIAEKIQELAKKSGDELERNLETTEQVQQLVPQLVDIAQSCLTMVEEGTKFSSSAKTSFAEVAVSAEQVARRMNEIGEAVQTQSQNILDIHQLSQKLASIAQESAAGAQNVASITEETSAAVENITSSARQLAALAENLQEHVPTEFRR